MVGILFVGIIAYPRLPVAPLPQVDFPTIQISAQLPGASPDTMASRRRSAAGDQIRADFRRLADDLRRATLGSTAITHPIRPRAPISMRPRRCPGRINAASGQLPTNLPSPPTYRQGKPGRFSHSSARRHVAKPCG